MPSFPSPVLMLPLRAGRQNLQRVTRLTQQYQRRLPLELRWLASTVTSASNGEPSAKLTPPPPPGQGDHPQHLHGGRGQSQLQSLFESSFWPNQVPSSAIGGPDPTGPRLVYSTAIPWTVPVPTKSEIETCKKPEKQQTFWVQETQKTQQINPTNQLNRTFDLADHSGDTIIMSARGTSPTKKSSTGTTDTGTGGCTFR